uniref:non-specific serine/threonine protein kinase n=1 Tax=Oryza brachyantha TaxID=4533 RepID=J3N113_ORYBR
MFTSTTHRSPLHSTVPTQLPLMSHALLLLLVQLHLAVASLAVARSPDDRAGSGAVLRSFLASLPPASRRVLRPSWRDAPATHCAFLGVTCDAAGAVPAALAACSRLATLVLSFNMLAGAVPPELLSSRRLRKVDLNSNALTGEIPAGLIDSSVLEYLDLSVNSLSGTIPPELAAALPELTYLDLNSNNLSGPMLEFPARCGLVYLSLYSNQLTGELPRSLANCGSLTVLYLPYNKISGKVPDFFASMPNLQKLYLDDNSFTGELPASIGQLVKLEELAVSTNAFTGSVPAAIGQCQSLTVLYLNGNMFTGPIPKFIGNLSQLQVLSIADNGFTGEILPEIGKCRGLVELQLQNNSLSGMIPPEIGELRQLQKLYLFNNILHGLVPPALWQLSDMVELLLNNNSLSGEIHSDITQMKNLRNITLYDNNFTGVLPQALGLNTTPGLLHIDLTRNHLCGAIPPGLCTGGQLAVLDLGYNHFDGGFPSEIAKCQSLNRVNLNDNLLNGSLPAELATNIGLSYIDMSRNLLEGTIPSALGSWSNLTMLDLSSNRFSGPIPRELSNLSNLATLRMSSNRLTGPIPHELGNCKELAILDLGNNLLSGSIPAEITALGSLQNLLLGGNNLSGTVPDSFTATQALLELQLGDNSLEGAIPRSLGSLQYISKGLNISNNRLSNQIPSSLGNLQDLEVLDLSNNSLSGTIPSQLSNMISLSIVNVSFNNLSGQLPAGWAKLVARSPEGFMGNPQLCVNSSDIPCFKSQSAKNGTWKIRIVVGFLLSSLSAMVASLFAIRYILKRSQHLSTNRVSVRSMESTEELPEELTYEDILRGTDNWSEKYVIGRGRHGTVYRTECKLGKQWAVKTVDLSQCKLPIEMKILNTVKHRNIVRMAGYCIRGSVGIILYEYMPEGTLFELLHRRQPYVALDWMVRHQIAFGVAQGLSYLHHDCVPMIVHRDVKSSNILMDTDLVPKLTDFGMGKIVADEDADATVSVIVGTLGYIAPEHGYSTRLTEKSDVYSYGVVLLELLCRKMAVDPAFGDGVDIVTWMRSNLGQAADGRSIMNCLDEEIMYWPEDEQSKALDLLDLAMSCAQLACQSRPSMRDVVNNLMRIDRFVCKNKGRKGKESTHFMNEGRESVLQKGGTNWRPPSLTAAMAHG